MRKHITQEQFEALKQLEEDYKQQIAGLLAEINALRKQKNKITQTIKNHNFVVKNYGLKNYEITDCYQSCGKRLRDLTAEEKREYQRKKTAEYRAKKKENMKNG